MKPVEDELREVKVKILKMGSLVEEAIGRAIRSLVERNNRFAEEVIEGDRVINTYDVEIDEECIRVLALRQPVGGDLRFITTAMKITTDLERIGDLAVNLCERVLDLLEAPPLKPLIDLPKMADKSRAMLRAALDSYVTRNADQAQQVCAMDDEVDRLNDQVFRELLTYMMESPANISRALGLIMISRYLERIADHATNLAEMVIYLAKGKDIRHMAWKKDNEAPKAGG